MKLLCVSDQIDPFVYSTSVKERYGDVDAVFCAGDLPMDYVDFIVTALNKPTFFIFGNHDLKDFHLYKKSVRVAQPSSFTAMDSMNNSHGGDYVSNRVLRCKHLSFTDSHGKTTPLLIAGVSGSLRYNNGLDQYSEREMFFQLLALVPGLLWNRLRYGRWCDIFLTHASPRHIHDREDQCHKGFECFNWFIRKFHPALLIHGHIHLYDLQDCRVTMSHSTMVVNAYSRITIDMEPEFPAAKGESLGFTLSVHTNE
ncbi:MAG: metallophosphoesterase [Treponema sp.]|nr:metallophosphoesterase [Treponema sp.]